MPARDLPLTTTARALKQRAAERARVRLRGTVDSCGDGKAGRYRNRWLVIRTPAGLVKITASTTTPLGTAQPGARVDLAVTLTGMLDLAAGHFLGERAQCLSLIAERSLT